MNSALARAEMSAMLERHLKKAEQIEREGPEAAAASMLALSERGRVEGGGSPDDRRDASSPSRSESAPGYFTPEFHREYAAGHYRDWIEVLDGLTEALRRCEREANELTNRSERLEAALQRIAHEPPDRGLTPNFRQFARAALEDSEKGSDLAERLHNEDDAALRKYLSSEDSDAHSKG